MSDSTLWDPDRVEAGQDIMLVCEDRNSGASAGGRSAPRRAPALMTVVPALLAAACAPEAPEWSDAQIQAVYGAAIDVLRIEVGNPDTLFVDPGSRFLVPDSEGALRMGDFNRYGDPVLRRAILSRIGARTCGNGSDDGCDRTVNELFVVLSEVLPLGPREAVVLGEVIRTSGQATSTEQRIYRFRYRRDGWEHTDTLEGDAIWAPDALGPPMAGLPAWLLPVKRLGYQPMARSIADWSLAWLQGLLMKT